MSPQKLDSILPYLNIVAGVVPRRGEADCLHSLFIKAHEQMKAAGRTAQAKKESAGMVGVIDRADYNGRPQIGVPADVLEA